MTLWTRSMCCWRNRFLPKRSNKVLFVWAVRHPASGYVQGLNDVLLPFLLVFLAAKVGRLLEDLDPSILKTLKPEDLDEVEADTLDCVVPQTQPSALLRRTCFSPACSRVFPPQLSVSRQIHCPAGSWKSSAAFSGAHAVATALEGWEG